MLALSPREKLPGRILRSQIIWLFQLASLEDFLRDFYSTEVRRIAPRLASATQEEYSDLLEHIVKHREGLSLALADLYWIESDFSRTRSATFIAQYKRRFKLDERLNAVQKRFTSAHEREDLEPRDVLLI